MNQQSSTISNATCIKNLTFHSLIKLLLLFLKLWSLVGLFCEATTAAPSDPCKAYTDQTSCCANAGCRFVTCTSAADNSTIDGSISGTFVLDITSPTVNHDYLPQSILNFQWIKFIIVRWQSDLMITKERVLPP